MLYGTVSAQEKIAKRSERYTGIMWITQTKVFC